MRVHHELRGAVLALLSLQIVTTLAAVVLLGRTSTSIERILDENDYSLAAVEEMQHVLALGGAAEADPATRARFQRALDRARANITEAEETPVLDAIAGHAEGALGGAADARAALLGHLERLAAINRRSMKEADDEASRLAQSGAWAVVALAVLAMTLGVLAVRRANARLVEPLHELHDTVLAWRRGDILRRSAVEGMPLEAGAIGRALNELLDAHCAPVPPPGASARGPAEATRDREIVLGLLDQEPGPAVVVDERGAVLAASRRALDALSKRGGREGALDGEARPLGGGLRLVRLAGGGDERAEGG